MDEPGAPGTAASVRLLGCGRPSGPWLSLELIGNGISSETQTCVPGKQSSARGQGLTNWLPPSPWEARGRGCVRASRECACSRAPVGVRGVPVTTQPGEVGGSPSHCGAFAGHAAAPPGVDTCPRSLLHLR